MPQELMTVISRAAEDATHTGPSTTSDSDMRMAFAVLNATRYDDGQAAYPRLADAGRLRQKAAGIRPDPRSWDWRVASGPKGVPGLAEAGFLTCRPVVLRQARRWQVYANVSPYNPAAVPVTHPPCLSRCSH